MLLKEEINMKPRKILKKFGRKSWCGVVFVRSCDLLENDSLNVEVSYKNAPPSHVVSFKMSKIIMQN